MTAPLTAEVTQIIGALKDRQASWVGDGSSPDKLCHDAADMLAALATQLAERDAELAQVKYRLVNAYLLKTELNDLANEERRNRLAALSRIAALTEALQLANDTCGMSDNTRSVVTTALTTDKEPKT